MSWGFAALSRYFQIVAAADAELAKPGRGKSEGSSSLCNPSYAKSIGVEPWRIDLATVDASELRQRAGLRPGELGVLVCCPPCTGFSQKMAQNHRIDDHRNQLVRRVPEFVRAFLPRFLVMENVKELLTGRNRHHFDAVRDELVALGYDVWADVHDLSTFGLPQRRVRTLVLASRDGTARPLPPGSPGHLTTVRDAIGHLPAVGQGVAHPDDPDHVCPRHTAPVSERIFAIPRDGGSWSDLLGAREDLLIPSMVGKRSGSFPDVYGRLAWDRPAVTITRECGHPGNGRYLHPEQDRMLTVREMAILQGFPPGFAFVGPVNARYNQIGDAVPPLVSRIMAGHVSRLLAETANRQAPALASAA